MKKILAIAIATILAGCGGDSGNGSDGNVGGGGGDINDPKPLIGDTSGAVAFGITANESFGEAKSLESFLKTASTDGYCDRLVKVVSIDIETYNEAPDSEKQASGQFKTVKVFSSLNDGGSCIIDEMTATMNDIILSGTFKNVANAEGEAVEVCNMIRMPLRSRDSQAECLIPQTDDFRLNAIEQIAVSSDGMQFGITYNGENLLETDPDYRYKTASAVYENGVGFGSDNFAFYTADFDKTSRTNSSHIGRNAGQYVFNHSYYNFSELIAEYYPSSGGQAEDFTNLISSRVPIITQGMGHFSQVQLGDYLLTHPFESDTSTCPGGVCVDNARLISIEDGPQSVIGFDLVDPEWDRVLQRIVGEVSIYDDKLGHIFFGTPDKNFEPYVPPYITAYAIDTDSLTLTKVHEFTGAHMSTHWRESPVSVVQHGDTIIYAYAESYQELPILLGFNLTERQPLLDGANLLEDFADWHGIKTTITANGFKVHGQHLGQTKTMYYNQKTDSFDTSSPDETELGNSIPLMPSIPN